MSNAVGISFVLTQDFKAPYVVATNKPHDPTQIMMRFYKRGTIVRGKVSKATGMVIVDGIVPLPFSVLKQVVTKSINNSNADGIAMSAENNPKIKINSSTYMDGALIGASIGFVIGGVGAYYADKKQWTPNAATLEAKIKIAGIVAAIGAAIGSYLVYRKKKIGENKIKIQN